MKAIGKITAKIVLGDLLKTKPPEGTRIEAMRIQGRVDNVVTKPSALNPENLDVKLTGEFIATNCTTGEQFTSATLYPIGSGMVDLMSKAEKGSMFAMRIFLAHSSRTVQGYSFDFESALEIKPSDAVQRLGDAFLTLPAPVKKAVEEKVPTGKNHK